MKKILLFIIISIFCPVCAFASENFYMDKQKVEGMWVTKVEGDKYESFNPYFLKNVKDDSYGFCIEPFAPISSSEPYTLDYDLKKYGLTQEQINRINLILYYGYGYKNHDNDKWYGITQYLIWKAAAPNADIYFADGKDGERINVYEKEIKEIEELISEHNIKPIVNSEYKMSTNQELEIPINVNLDNYKVSSDLDVIINDNKFHIKNNNPGTYEVKLEKINNRFKNNFLLFYSKNSQNVIYPGNSDIYNYEFSFKVVVEEGTFKLVKYSNDTNETLMGAKYGIYSNDELVKEIETDEKGESIVALPYGKYIVKELVPPSGFKLDEKSYEFEITSDSLNVSLDLLDDRIIIEVPSTGSTNYTGISSIAIGIVGLLYVKKKDCLC